MTPSGVEHQERLQRYDDDIPCEGFTFGPKATRMFSRAETSVTANLLIFCGRWVFFSNKLVSYWPFSVNCAENYSRQKYLNFHFLTWSTLLSVVYISLNVFYVIHYFTLKKGEDPEVFQPIDLILLTVWDLMVVVSVAAHRVYGMFQLSKFHSFWEEITSAVTQIVAISSEVETEARLCSPLRKWTLKWLLLFLLLGIVDCSAVVYHYTFVSEDNLLTTLMFEYLEIVICMHNSSALILIFFIKIMSYGFAVSKQKLTELSVTLPLEYEMISMTTLKYPDDNRPCSSRATAVNRRKDALLRRVFKLIDDLERCVHSFNKLFVFSLFLEGVLGFWQVMFSLYFLHMTSIQHFAFAVNMAVPIITYPACFISLCVAASQLTVECQNMVGAFQTFPLATVSPEDTIKIQILVARFTSTPPAIQVSQLFQIRESLLGSALNTLATYFIVLVQMRQITKSHGNGRCIIGETGKINYNETIPREL